MPLYEYTCRDCEAEFEQLVRSAAAERDVLCPGCGGHRIQRKLSTFAAHGARGESLPLPRASGCGRCGDPNGPCALD